MSDNNNHLPPDQLTDPLSDWNWEPISTEILRDIRYRDVKVIVGLATWCGWMVHKGKLFHLVAVDGTKMEVPTNTNLNHGVFRNKVRTILRHRVTDDNAPIGAMVEEIIGTFHVDASHAQVLRKMAAEVKPVPVEDSYVIVPPTKKAAVASLPTADDSMTTDPDVRRITKVEPWAAHTRTNKKGGTLTYPSKAVMQRDWSDGAVDYACRWEGCSYVNESPISTARHFAAHRRGSGKAVQAPPDGVDPNWTPQKHARIARLRGEVDGALTAALSRGIDFTVEDEALWIATWIIEHRVEPLHEAGETVPRELTPEEILDRIAALVDRGRGTILREQNETLNAQVEDLLGQLDEARQRVIDAENEINEWAAVEEILAEKLAVKKEKK